MIANMDGAGACGTRNHQTSATDMEAAVNRESEAALERLISNFGWQ